jgi:hypothetical protein
MHEGKRDSYAWTTVICASTGAIVWSRKTIGCIARATGQSCFVTVIDDIMGKHA